MIKPLTIHGIGIDAVETARFNNWYTYNDKKLQRLFSADEITYCRACPTKSTERFAVRFAAREALYKALCQAYPKEKWIFLRICKNTKISHGLHGQPEITINWQKVANSNETRPQILLSLAHTNSLAMAWVIIEKPSTI